MAELTRSGNKSAVLATMVEIASQRFPIPAVAEIAIRNRLATRKAKVQS